MCPELPLLEQLALGLLSAEESLPLEEHLAMCERCLQTVLASNPSDTLVEALREAPRTAERRAAVENEIERLQAAFAAQLRDPYQTRALRDSSGPSPTEPARSGDPRPTSDDTPPSGSIFSTTTPRPEARTEPDYDDQYNILAPPQLPDEMGRLGNYRVLRVLGTGGMGVVFEAEDPQLKRHVALKAMKPGGAISASSRKRFLREAQAAASVEHDHIVPVYQVGEDRGVPFIAMPLLRGETLAERLERCAVGNPVPLKAPAVGPHDKETSGQGDKEKSARGPFPTTGVEHSASIPGSGEKAGASEPSSPRNLSLSPGPLVSLSSSNRSEPAPLPLPELVRIGREIALGLAAAHRRGLIHRDIKPSNIWLEEETGRAKILDFGLARAAEGGEQLTQAGAMLGTPAYMSPEQASGDDADARSDLFSLGCVLYHGATGRRPFIGRDALTTMVAVTTTMPPAPRELNASLPDDLNALIVSLLSKDPAGRSQTAREVAERLASVVNALTAAPDSVGNGLGAVPGADTALLPLPPGEGRGEGGLNQSSPFSAQSLPAPVGNAHPTKPPRRRGLILLASAAAAAALLAGIVITIKNEKDETVARLETDRPFEMTNLAPGHKMIVEQKVDDKAEGKRQKAETSVARGQSSVATDNGLRTTDNSGNPKSKIQNPKSPPPLPAMSAMSLVAEPAPIPGLMSWTLETIDHRGDIYKMEFNPDGTLLATYGEDGAVRLWNSETGELARIFVGADSPSGGIAWSPDGASIAVAAGTKIRAWQAATGKNVCTIALQDGEVASLAWSPDGKTFAFGQRPLDQPEAPARQLCLYDAATGKRIADRHRDDWSVEQIAWSPDSKRLLISGDEHHSFLVERDGLVTRQLTFQQFTGAVER